MMIFRRLIKGLLWFFVPALIVIIVLATSPGVRFTVFRIATELPFIAIHFVIRKHVKSHDFVGAAAELERQLRFIRWTGSKKSSMVRGLIANTEFVMKRADLTGDFAALGPFLRHFVEYQPRLYISRYWLAKALSYTDPKESLVQAEAAVRMVASDDRAYRVAIRASLALGDRKQAWDWCKRYSTAQFGGTRPLVYTNIFAGVGIRKIALEVPGSLDLPVRVPNEGVQLGKRTTYDFDLPKRTKKNSIRLLLGLLPGIKVRLHEVVLYGPEARRTILPDDLIIVPEHGYVLKNNVIITSGANGGALTIISKSKNFGSFDRVDIDITFERAGIASNPECEGR